MDGLVCGMVLSPSAFGYGSVCAIVWLAGTRGAFACIVVWSFNTQLRLCLGALEQPGWCIPVFFAHQLKHERRHGNCWVNGCSRHSTTLSDFVTLSHTMSHFSGSCMTYSLPGILCTSHIFLTGRSHQEGSDHCLTQRPGNWHETVNICRVSFAGPSLTFCWAPSRSVHDVAVCTALWLASSESYMPAEGMHIGCQCLPLGGVGTHSSR
jgi:hypothetical protein